jgi:hypothetical protein
MKFFQNKSKAHGLYAKAKNYLTEHDIPYMLMPKTKSTISFIVENIKTEHLAHFGLRILRGKLMLLKKASFLQTPNDEEVAIEHIEDFTTVIYRSKFEE